MKELPELKDKDLVRIHYVEYGKEKMVVGVVDMPHGDSFYQEHLRLRCYSQGFIAHWKDFFVKEGNTIEVIAHNAQKFGIFTDKEGNLYNKKGERFK